MPEQRRRMFRTDSQCRAPILNTIGIPDERGDPAMIPLAPQARECRHASQRPHRIRSATAVRIGLWKKYRFRPFQRLTRPPCSGN